MSKADLSQTVSRLRGALDSEDYPSEAARRVALRSVLHEACVGLTMEEIGGFLDAVRSHFPDRTYEASARASALEVQLAAAQRENTKLAADLQERTAQLRGLQRLIDQIYGTAQQLEASGKAIMGGSSAQAPRDPEALAPFIEAVCRILTFAVKQEKIALSVEETIGHRGSRAIDGDSLGKLLKTLARGTASATESGELTAPGQGGDRGAAFALPKIEAKLSYLGLLPGALLAGVQQSWRGGTTSILEYLEPSACEKDVPAKIPGLRDVAVLREVKRRFEEFWGDLDRNVTHYYRGTFEKVYAEKMEERG
ncbi:MAG: hypothetical protein R3E12_03485 [Candidatus Eisenbacteria bacterium]